MQIKTSHITCAWQHEPIIIIIIAIKIVDIDVRAASVAEQAHLVCHLLLCKKNIGFIDWHGFFDNTIIFIYVRLHFCLNSVNKLLCDLEITLLGTIITVSDRKLHLDLLDLIRPYHIIDRFHQNHRRRAIVRLVSRIIRQCQKIYSTVLVNLLEQLLYLSVSDCQRNRIWIFFLIHTGNLPKGDSHRV